MTSLSDAELKRIVSKGYVLKVGDIVTCKEEHSDNYGYTKHGIDMRIINVYENDPYNKDKIKVEIIDESSERHEHTYVVPVEHFELI